MLSALDHAMMRRALTLAERGRRLSPPNPAVGCVLVDAAATVLGEGFTQPVGQAHAEVMALRDAAARGHRTQGATAYVTLEPCAHHGRTGPCCDALVAAGVRRVVAALPDPNPRVGGQGLQRLRDAGVEVALGPPEVAAAARELNIGFFTRMERGTPWVRLKVASSLDGRTALPDGRSQWITSPAARADAQAWRARACAVLTGIGTVLDDDPLLNVRLPDSPRQPALVVLDSQLRTPAQARLWQVAGRRVCIATAVTDAARQQPLQARGAQVLALPGDDGRVDLPALLAHLARQEVNELHVEAGAVLNGALMTQGWVDEYLIYQAPRLLGVGRPLAHLPDWQQIDEAMALEFTDTTRIGPDLRLLARPAGAKPF